MLLNTAPTPVFLHTATPTHAPQTLCAPETNEPDVANPAPHTTPLHATHPCTLRVLQTALIVPLQARRHAGTQARRHGRHAATHPRSHARTNSTRTHARTRKRTDACTQAPRTHESRRSTNEFQQDSSSARTELRGQANANRHRKLGCATADALRRGLGALWCTAGLATHLLRRTTVRGRSLEMMGRGGCSRPADSSTQQHRDEGLPAQRPNAVEWLQSAHWASPSAFTTHPRLFHWALDRRLAKRPVGATSQETLCAASCCLLTKNCDTGSG